MTKVLIITLLVVLVALCNSFIQPKTLINSRNKASSFVSSSDTKINSKNELKMMFGMFSGGSGSSSIPANKKVCVITGMYLCHRTYTSICISKNICGVTYLSVSTYEYITKVHMYILPLIYDYAYCMITYTYII